jgi:hypothetical protein
MRTRLRARYLKWKRMWRKEAGTEIPSITQHHRFSHFASQQSSYMLRGSVRIRFEAFTAMN